MGGAQFLGGFLVVVGIALIVVSQIIGGIITGEIDSKLTDQKNTQFVCKGDETVGRESDTYKTFSGSEYWDPEAVPAYYDLYLFSINNAAAYLQGDKAEVIEVGPFVFQVFSKKVNIEVGENTTKFNSISTYHLLDGDRSYIGRFEGPETTRTIKGRMHKDLTKHTQIHSFNLGYIGVLGKTKNEIALVLTAAGCSAKQIENIALLGSLQIDDPTKADYVFSPTKVDTCDASKKASGDVNCACCALEDTMRGLNAGGFLSGGVGACSSIEKAYQENGASGLLDILTSGGTNSAAIAMVDTLNATEPGKSMSDFEFAVWASTYGCMATGAYGDECVTPGAATPVSDPTSTTFKFYAPIVDAGIREKVRVRMAANGLVRCETVKPGVTNAQLTTVPACLSKGTLLGRDLTGMFCKSAKGWKDATKIMQIGAAYGTYRYLKAKEVDALAESNTAAAAAFAAQAMVWNTTMATAQGIEHQTCNAYMNSDTSPAVGLLSLLSNLDGGTPVKVSSLLGGPAGFTATAMGEFTLTSGLIASNSANDLIYGRPGAFLGYFSPMLGIPGVWGAILKATNGNPTDFGFDDLADFKKKALNGQLTAPFAADYPVAYDQAGYTEDFKEVCSPNCAVVDIPGSPMSPYRYQCNGTAPDRFDAFYEGKEELLQFASNECRPLSWTFATKYFCGAIEMAKQSILIGKTVLTLAGGNPANFAAALAGFKTGVGLNPASAGTVDMSKFTHTFTAAEVTALWTGAVAGGAASKGVSVELFLAGFNSQMKDNGLVSCECAADRVNATDPGFMGCCLAEGVVKGTPLTGFGCLTKLPGFFNTPHFEDGNIHNSLQRSEDYWETDAETHQSIINTCPNDGDDIAQWKKNDGATYWNITDTYTAKVVGGDGTKFKPMGLTAAAGEKAISRPDAHHNDTTLLYVSQAKRPLTLNFVKNHLYGEKVNVARFGPGSGLLNAADAAENVGGPGDPEAADKGHGTVMNGLADIQFFAPSNLPMFLSTPYAVLGDTEAFVAQHDIYHCWEYGKYTGSKDILDEDGVFNKTRCNLADAEWVKANADHMMVMIDVEPSLGLAIGGHSRLQANIKGLTKCDPATVVACKLGFNTAKGSCHKAAAAYQWSTFDAQLKGLLEFHIKSIEGKSAWTSTDAGFPCSDANVFSPNFQGGNIMPIYWADVWAAATDDLLDALVKAGDMNASAKSMGTMFVGGGAAALVIGIILIVLCKSKAAVAP